MDSFFCCERKHEKFIKNNKSILKPQQRFRSEKHNVLITKEDTKEHNPNWPEVPEHPYKILIVGGSGFGKTNL